MKYFFSLFLIWGISNHCYSQLLVGKWKGSFSTNYDGREMQTYSPIELEFIISNDTSYKVFCYSQGHSLKKVVDWLTSTVYYDLLAKDSIYLSEIKIVAPLDANPKCLKKMYLRIINRNNRVRLEGVWESFADECKVSGTINFWRKK